MYTGDECRTSNKPLYTCKKLCNYTLTHGMPLAGSDLKLSPCTLRELRVGAQNNCVGHSVAGVLQALALESNQAAACAFVY